MENNGVRKTLEVLAGDLTTAEKFKIERTMNFSKLKDNLGMSFVPTAIVNMTVEPNGMDLFSYFVIIGVRNGTDDSYGVMLQTGSENLVDNLCDYINSGITDPVVIGQVTTKKGNKVYTIG